MREPDRKRNRLRDQASPVDLICVPMALGADREGVEEGPFAIERQLKAHLEYRGFPEITGRLSSPTVVDVMPLDDARAMEQTVENALHAAPIAEACERLAAIVQESIRAGNLPLILGGDHALSIGALAGASGAGPGRLGVIWIDAHGDINTPDTTPSKHIHGMPLAVSLGYGPNPLVELGYRFDLALDDLVYIGVRDLDPGERELLRQSPALVYTMESIDSMGISAVTEEAIRRLLDRGVDAVHVSLDLDALDPTVLPGTGTTVPGGLTYREARRCLTMLRASELPVTSADIVELNPRLDPGDGSTKIAARLTAALLGEELA